MAFKLADMFVATTQHAGPTSVNSNADHFFFLNDEVLERNQNEYRIVSLVPDESSS